MPSYSWKSDQFKFMSYDQLIDIWDRAGFVYETSIDISLNQSESVESIFASGSRPVVIFSRELSFNDIGINAEVLRPDPNGSPVGSYTGGSLLEYYNANDICPQPNYQTPAGEQPQGDRIYTDVTITGDWINSRAPRPIFGPESNQSSGAIAQAIGAPQVIGPNSLLQFILTNRSSSNAQNVSSYLRWASVPNIGDYIFDATGAFTQYKGPIQQIGE